MGLLYLYLYHLTKEGKMWKTKRRIASILVLHTVRAAQHFSACKLSPLESKGQWVLCVAYGVARIWEAQNGVGWVCLYNTAVYALHHQYARLHRPSGFN